MQEDDNELARVNLIITGRVQGVFFRASALEQAQSLSLTGFVQNLPDASIEIEAEGTRYALSQLIAWCKYGPPDARVEDVFVRWGPHRGEHRTFRVVG